MMMKPRTFILLASLLGAKCILAESTLPEYMIGEYEYVSGDNYDKFLSAIGIGLFQRTLLAATSPKQTIRQVGDEIEIIVDIGIGGRIAQSNFKLGSPYVETTLKGDKIPTIATLEENKLKKVKKPDNGLEVEEVREFLDNGNTMNLYLSVIGKPEADALRVFKKKN
ncbi:myelin P2 protein [Eurytemora carolleeae]|uniref:myelin P2 protein n=1 Tax=Eurytemora carolleeae TaxID=1294199 RepID=UPI000C78AB4B|nr:myelin P2 protein [Eurytemora carolleeae]|eukprot:XP_023327689.1 myelin P2 protein-like [Eurytemora affinis]